MTRLPANAAEVIDRARPLTFRLDGRLLQAFAGDTVGSAMAAGGVTITGRSFKYHRPRGLFCMTGACANCLVTVDGVPNVRACLEPVRDRMDVRRQNAWPSADFDVLRIFDWCSFALPAGFYYKAFHRPRFVWPLVEPVIRRVAGLGRVPRDVPASHGEKIHLHPDVLVVGGGRSGLQAAIAAARTRKRTVLLEARPHLGGRLRTTNPAAVMALEREAREAGVDLRLSTFAFGVFEELLVAAAAPDQLLRIRPVELVVATGVMDQPAVFPDNDLPGIMLAEGVDRLVRLYGVLPGRRVVVASYGEQGDRTASLLREAGAEVTLIHPPADSVQRAIGGRRIRGVVANDRTLPCDLLVIGGITAPVTGLLAQAGPGVSAIGSVAAQPPASRGSEFRAEPGKQFTCLCMDVTVKEMKQAIDEGFDSIELLKRYTTLSMGPCQGKACLRASIQVTARLTEKSVQETGTTTARPPFAPVALGILAAGHLVPRKETAIHDRHVEAGAEFMWAGDWRRPHHYQDPKLECQAVHERVALIDVSSLGKFRIQGPDAVTFLERLYPSKIADLKVGRIRYGAMLNDQGVILDDGTICRLGDREFFVTTTTGGTAGMEQWIKWWLADWGLDVQVMNVSGGYAAINLAGPRSRDAMQRLAAFDVSATALPYLSSARGELAGVPVLVLRIGFVGELSYEIHAPSAYGVHLWDQLMEAGHDLGIAAFGLEAQRILRLEKQHLIVGQDTDALSTPYAAGLPWMVKLDKPDFLGRRSLVDLQEHGPLERLVGFTVERGQPPPEGAAVVEADRPVGRVCSSRWSDVQHAGVGMAWVPSGWAEDGRPLEIVYDGHRATARIVLKPFYDPEGKRLRS